MNYTLIREAQSKMNTLVSKVDDIISLINGSDYSQEEVNSFLDIAEKNIQQANECFETIKNEFKKELNKQADNGN